MLLAPDDSPDVPSQNVIDPVSGYSLMIPATQQGYPAWWLQQPDAYLALKDARSRQNVSVDDGITEWEKENPDAVAYYASVK